MNKYIIHFHSSDNRFCGSTQKPRRFTFEPNEVTCSDCKNNDSLLLTARDQDQLVYDHIIDSGISEHAPLDSYIG